MRTHTVHTNLLKEEGPDHNKSFEVSAMLDGQEIGRGIGRTKKSAEQRAAYRGDPH